MSIYCKYVVTHLEQLQYDLCECSTKSQAPTFSVSSSSQVPLVVAENFLLETGGGRGGTISLVYKTTVSSAPFHVTGPHVFFFFFFLIYSSFFFFEKHKP